MKYNTNFRRELFSVYFVTDSANVCFVTLLLFPRRISLEEIQIIWCPFLINRVIVRANIIVWFLADGISNILIKLSSCRKILMVSFFESGFFYLANICKIFIKYFFFYFTQIKANKVRILLGVSKNSGCSFTD